MRPLSLRFFISSLCSAFCGMMIDAAAPSGIFRCGLFPCAVCRERERERFIGWRGMFGLVVVLFLKRSNIEVLGGFFFSFSGYGKLIKRYRGVEGM